VVFACLLSVATACGACSSSTQSVTSASTTKCGVSAVATPASFPAIGGSGILAVLTNRDCQWSAAASPWIQLDDTATKLGAADLSFSVAPNPDLTVRKGTISIADTSVAITQDATACVFTVAPRTASVSAGGGRQTLAVTASSQQCPWTARSDSDWLAVLDGAQRTGSGQLTYEARGTTGPARTATLLVAGQSVTVTQTPGCATSFTPTAQSVASSGGSGSVAVVTDAACTWSSRSDAAWVVITGGQTGTGPGTVRFSVDAWDGPARSGTLTIDGRPFTVTQATGCRYTVDSASQSVAAAGGSGNVTVHAAAGCGWSASTSVPWLMLVSGTTGSGDGRVQFTVAASTGPARSGTLTIADQAFTVTQASGCSYTLAPASVDVGNGGGSGTIAVTTAPACAWTATSSVPWITITGSPSAAGSGAVTFSVLGQPMGLPARTGTIIVNQQTVTVNQAAGVPCVYAIDPTAQAFSAAAGAGSFSVSTVLTCPWTAYSNDPWITITGFASGAGNGTVSFSVAANPAGSPARVGTIGVRGPTFTITQSAAP
jgi:Viral BACON domain/Putative binding domain, N-terminal